MFREACSWQMERGREGWIFSKGRRDFAGSGSGWGLPGGVARS